MAKQSQARKKVRWKVVLLTALSISIIGWVGTPFLLRMIDSIYGNYFFTEGGCFKTDNGMTVCAGKPVIYLYPEKKSIVNVKIAFKGRIIADYPKYSSDYGWNVTAYPDGTLVNSSDKMEYSYLFWEGLLDKEFSQSPESGFIVKGSDARNFLQQKLTQLGLEPKEYNEFIVYWYPRLAANEWNLVYFAGNEYTEQARLIINPKPDSMLRVFMVMKKIEDPIDLPVQELSPFERKGFTVVEWGGTELN